MGGCVGELPLGWAGLGCGWVDGWVGELPLGWAGLRLAGLPCPAIGWAALPCAVLRPRYDRATLHIENLR